MTTRASLGSTQHGDGIRWPAEVIQSVNRYLESLAKPDGGYGWIEQYDSHLSVTFAVVGACHFLGVKPFNSKNIAEFIRKAHPIKGPLSQTRKHWTDLKEFDFQQIQSLLWLGEDVSDFRKTVQGWKKVSSYTAAYEKGQNPVFRQEMQTVFCRQLLGLPMGEVAEEFAQYLAVRERKNGSFNNTPAGDGSDGHIVNTYFGLRAREALGERNSREAVGWIKRCQRPSGGFTWNPAPVVGDVEDVTYTWAAIRALKLLGEKPDNIDECTKWLSSLWNEDGGFSDKPGSASTPIATYMVLDALGVLNALPVKQRRTLPETVKLSDRLQVFSIQIQAPGEGSPSETVELARRLRIHLWGAKNSSPEWLKCVQVEADKKNVPVTFFSANEEYGTLVGVPGLGSYTHVNDPVFAPGLPSGAWQRKEGGWEQFRSEKLQPLNESGGRMMWQICDNEEFARILLDESAARGGYAAISTFHFGCHNMAWTLPFVMRYQHDIPLVSLQDAHIEAWWWSFNLEGFRTVYLAEKPGWDGWLEALKEKRVVAVRRDNRTGDRLRMLGGSTEVRRMVMDRVLQWQWWNDNGTVMDKMPVSVVVLRPADMFEEGRPEKGLALRVRTRRRWVEGKELLEKALVECESAAVDGVVVRLDKHEVSSKEKKLRDVYQIAALDELSAGEHSVELGLVEVETGKKFRHTVRIVV